MTLQTDQIAQTTFFFHWRLSSQSYETSRFQTSGYVTTGLNCRLKLKHPFRECFISGYKERPHQKGRTLILLKLPSFPSNKFPFYCLTAQLIVFFSALVFHMHALNFPQRLDRRLNCKGISMHQSYASRSQEPGFSRSSQIHGRCPGTGEGTQCGQPVPKRRKRGEAPGLPFSSCPLGWLLGTWCLPPLVSQEQSCLGSAGPGFAHEGAPGWADARAHRNQDHSRAHSHMCAPTTPRERTHSPHFTHEETEVQRRMTHSFNFRSWAASQQNSSLGVFL